ncbi:hypothetical protein [Ancylobacter sp. SL191]|nr:hypothetical protein [Ancylobacter sp. SL191]WAC26380.1 hypothetical protein OU996_15345 [Ancylobacter sp. SL191]
MTALGGVLTIVVIWAMWAPREVGDFIAKVVDGYEITRATLLAKREPKP